MEVFRKLIQIRIGMKTQVSATRGKFIYEFFFIFDVVIVEDGEDFIRKLKVCHVHDMLTRCPL